MAKAPNCFDFLIKTHRPDPSFMEAIGQAMAETIDKMNQPQIETTTFSTPFEIKHQIPHSVLWETTNRFYADEVEAIRAALLYSENRPNHLVGVFSGIFITKIRNGEPIRIYEGHEEKVIAALSTDVQNQMLDDMLGSSTGYLIYHKSGNLKWVSTNSTKYRDLKEAIIAAEEYAIHRMTVVRHIDGQDVVKFPVGGGKPCFINLDFRNQVDAALDVQNQPINVNMKLEWTPIKGSCPDCKDGFYYPFAGLREPCQTCH